MTERDTGASGGPTGGVPLHDGKRRGTSGCYPLGLRVALPLVVAHRGSARLVGHDLDHRPLRNLRPLPCEIPRRRLGLSAGRVPTRDGSWGTRSEEAWGG